MQAACVQMDIRWEDKACNHERARALVGAAAIEPAALLLLPEMFATGFSMDVAAIAEEDGGPGVSLLAELAVSRSAWVIGGVVTREPGTSRGRNEAALLDPDGQPRGRYTKRYPMTPAGEHEHYAPGDHIEVWPIGDTYVAPFICYDIRFPEDFRRAAMRGAEVFAVIANFPAVREHHWVTLLTARAIENQAYVVAVNRCGSDPKLAYPGRSMVIDPRGEVIADAGADEGVLLAELDLPALREYREKFPVLRDMRPW